MLDILKWLIFLFGFAVLIYILFDIAKRKSKKSDKREIL